MQSVKAGTKRMIREINEAIVLGAIRAHGQRSRAEIAADTGLSAPTVTGITSELIDRNIVYEHSTGESAGGRRPVMLALNSTAGYVIGAKVTETHVTAVLTDLEATVVHRRTRKLAGTSVDQVVRLIGAIVDDLRSKVDNRPIYGLGIGTAGVIDSVNGVVKHGTYAHWRDVPLGDRLQQRTGLPVVIDNDVNALVVCEHWFGVGREVSDLLVISLGRGIGLGMVLDGRLYRGAQGGAGEFGHVKVINDTTPCACGGEGCLEAIAADPALVRSAARVLGRDVDSHGAAAAARAGNDRVRTLYVDAATLLGHAVANVVNVLNPSLIVLSGEGTHAIDLMLDPFTTALHDRVFDGLADDLEITVERWEDEAWARGAASLVLAELFEPAIRPDAGAGRPSLELAAG